MPCDGLVAPMSRVLPRLSPVDSWGRLPTPVTLQNHMFPFEGCSFLVRAVTANMWQTSLFFYFVALFSGNVSLFSQSNFFSTGEFDKSSFANE